MRVVVAGVAVVGMVMLAACGDDGGELFGATVDSSAAESTAAPTTTASTATSPPATSPTSTSSSPTSSTSAFTTSTTVTATTTSTMVPPTTVPATSAPFEGSPCEITSGPILQRLPTQPAVPIETRFDGEVLTGAFETVRCATDGDTVWRSGDTHHGFELQHVGDVPFLRLYLGGEEYLGPTDRLELTWTDASVTVVARVFQLAEPDVHTTFEVTLPR